MPLAGDRARVVGAIGKAALAPGVVRQALQYAAILIGEDGDRAEMIGVEKAYRGHLLSGRVDGPAADHDVADREKVGPHSAHDGENNASRKFVRLARQP